jgi:hypothetical protein
MWNAALIDGPIPSFAFLGLDPEGQPIFGDPLPVYNINISAQIMTPALEPFVVEPQNPKRVFAGDDPQNRANTVCLSFADEAEARENLAEWWT